MAAVPADPMHNLCEEATCSICLDYFNNPVIAECGHNFCKGCLALCWGESGKEASCPQCREKIEKKSLRPNQHLANFVDITKKLKGQGAKWEEGKGGVCEKHLEPLKLFCKDNQTPICVVCDRSKEHKNHEVIPVEEAAQEYKDRIYSCLEKVKKEKKNIQKNKATTEEIIQDLIKGIEAKEQKTIVEFRQLQQFLEEQEKLYLAQMEEMKKEYAKIRDEHLSRLSDEISSLEGLIQEMEEKHQQPAIELLQDVQRTMQRIEKRKKCENPTLSYPVGVKWKTWAVHDIIFYLKGVIKDFKDVILSGQQEQKANITLDPDTAHPQLILSEDHKSVTWEEKYQDLLDSPGRFDKYPIVLASEGFTSGRHFWDVDVGSEEKWIMGVATKSVDRKGLFVLIPDKGFWAIGKWGGRYVALTSPCNSVLFLKTEPKRIRVFLNYAGGSVAFLDADTATYLHEFFAFSFAGETLLPFFHVHGKAHLVVSP